MEDVEMQSMIIRKEWKRKLFASNFLDKLNNENFLI